MGTEKPQTASVLSEKTLSNIVLFCDVAKANGTSVTLKELIALTSIDFTEEQLTESWKDYEVLSAKYTIVSGIVLELSDVEETASTQVAVREREISENFQRANSNISFATRFGSFLGPSIFEVLAISGSTSYLSVSRTDDLDFFCISKSGGMWSSFVKALILARLFRTKEKNSPWLCLSYVADKGFTEREFAASKNGLIARDAISARIIRGEDSYSNLLKENRWMSEYFPKLYNLRISKSSGQSSAAMQVSALSSIINLFLYYFAGNYIRLKSYLLNRKFGKEKKFSSIFKLRIGRDHCIYESQDYLRLRKMYSEFRS